MLQKPSDELLGWECAAFRFLRVTDPIAEGHLVVHDADDPVVAERDPEDIGREILQRGLPTTDRATINYPILGPRCGTDRMNEWQLTHGGAEFRPKQPGEGFTMHEEGAPADNPGRPIRGVAKSLVKLYTSRYE